jgi:hypothetical protein
MEKAEKKDFIKDDKIFLYDDGRPGPKTLKLVLITTACGKTRLYRIQKTSKGGYLFN